MVPQDKLLANHYLFIIRYAFAHCTVVTLESLLQRQP